MLFVVAIVVGAQGTAEVTKQANITMAGFVFFVSAIVVGLLSPAIPAQAPPSAATPSEVAVLRERLA